MNKIMLAIDDYQLPFKRNLCYYMSKPIIHEDPVVSPSGSADAVATQFFGTVLYDAGTYRMWYYGMPALNPCYAESHDGISWTKPDLGQVEIQGNKKNNALLLTDESILGVAVIKDDDDPDPQRRYKMVYNPRQEHGKVASKYGRPRSTLRTAISPDGIKWMSNTDYAIDVFAEHSSFYKFNGLFVVHAQALFPGENGLVGPNGDGSRQGYAWVSADFDTWLEAPVQAFTLPEPADPARRGHGLGEDGSADIHGTVGNYDQVHLGVGGVPFSNVVVGLYGFWHQRGWGEGGTNCDRGLVISNDGIHFREPVKNYVYISSQDSPSTPVAGKDFPTLLCQGNGLVNVGDKTRIYHGRWRNADGGYGRAGSPDYTSEVALAELPRDRWGALGLFPEEDLGHVWSELIHIRNDKIEISLNIDDAKNISVELSDEQFNLLPEYSGANRGFCLDSKGLECKVIWPKGDLQSFGSRPLRLRVNFKRIDGNNPLLYAVYLK